MKHSAFKQSIALAAALFINTPTISAFITAHETNIFARWLTCQQVYVDRNIADLQQEVGDSFLQNFKKQYEANLPALRELTPLLSQITNNGIQEDGHNLQAPINEYMAANFCYLYQAMEEDMPKVLDSLIISGMASAQHNYQELSVPAASVIEKYKAFSTLLFAQEDSFRQNEYRLAFANRLFEYCFNDATFPHYQNILTTHDFHPAGRFINTALWNALVGDGWKEWHENVLCQLKQQADEGNEIVYLAGGTDFYQLLRRGIYNITIIDPFLPTQERYFSEGWEFLISPNSLENEIRFGPSCNSIKMKCIGYEVGEPFYSKLSDNNILSLKKSAIVWNVYDRDNKPIGHVNIIRRPITQSDFIKHPQISLLMSYDELTYVALPDILSGWGIDPTILDNELTIHVKQLRKPISKNILCNIRIASMLNVSDLKFISLASDPT